MVFKECACGILLVSVLLSTGVFFSCAAISSPKCPTLPQTYLGNLLATSRYTSWMYSQVTSTLAWAFQLLVSEWASVKLINDLDRPIVQLLWLGGLVSIIGSAIGLVLFMVNTFIDTVKYFIYYIIMGVILYVVLTNSNWVEALPRMFAYLKGGSGSTDPTPALQAAA